MAGLDNLVDSGRRRPRQARSKVTVDAILIACAQLLRKHGYSQLTTRGIARRAGVSVGSMYQYFASKEAVVRALSTSHRDEMIGAIHRVMKDTLALSLYERTPIMVRALLEAKTADPDLNARLCAAMVEIDGPCFLTKDTEPFRGIVRATLLHHSDEIAVDDVELMSFLIVQSLEGVLGGVAVGEQEFETERLIVAVSGLVLGLLKTNQVPSAT